ncbi:hypothetical protein BCR41DRAFT_402204 [Lobosporangium transversale]|uniref:Uncharacterized protein n=1 Tax=Lobosporangium transversale TaxID=64571 RepID=A0A1Y2G735_9FUNG|nr:hypothetical protein BCR41DRAFT_402204 [Lobosporangium transversale]ORY96045.1 hypothetical protein BCR41DRAFT_402204 [Lobosporangium transversale]|eukprot:XP_021875477.1 hypothetical protein BCR41DRAFT_402204 [Lobosporangium transversale]
MRSEIRELKLENERLQKKIQELERSQKREYNAPHMQQATEKESLEAHDKVPNSRAAMPSGTFKNALPEPLLCTSKTRSAMSSSSTVKSGLTVQVPSTPQPPVRLSLLSNSNASSPRVHLASHVSYPHAPHATKTLPCESFPAALPNEGVIYKATHNPAVYLSHIPSMDTSASGVAQLPRVMGCINEETPMPGPIQPITYNQAQPYSTTMPPPPPPTSQHQQSRPWLYSARSNAYSAVPQRVAYQGRSIATVGQPTARTRYVPVIYGNNIPQEQLVRNRNSVTAVRTIWRQQ